MKEEKITPNNGNLMEITLESGERKPIKKIESDFDQWIYVTTEGGEVLYTTWADVTTPCNLPTKSPSN
jgi:hypothetical protein